MGLRESNTWSNHVRHDVVSPASEHAQMILDGHKLPWHHDRIASWERGERISPITIDMALTRACNYSCGFCYAMLQENDRSVISRDVMTSFLDDCAEMGVRGISLVSDGESTVSSAFDHTLQYGHSLGISMAVGTNGYVLNSERMITLLSTMTYIRVNFSAGEPKRYAEIMGVKEAAYWRVIQNIRDMVSIKRDQGLDTTIGIQMVLMPQDADQVMPFAKLGHELGVDYAVIKHCSDDEYGNLGVDYGAYGDLYGLLQQAESHSTDNYKCVVKWSKIASEGHRSYQRCYGPPFLIQISGSGLVAPCGMLFNDRYAKFHIGNICEQRWLDIWRSDRYWEVMGYLSSDQFNAQKSCGTLCLQHKVNEALDQHIAGQKITSVHDKEPLHVNFV